jgi:hypothetical protein
VEGFELPSRTTYRIRDQVLSDERTIAACPNPPALTAAAFATPSALPGCDVRSSP